MFSSRSGIEWAVGYEDADSDDGSGPLGGGASRRVAVRAGEMGQGILGFWLGLTIGMTAIGILYLARFRWLVDRLSVSAPGDSYRALG